MDITFKLSKTQAINNKKTIQKRHAKQQKEKLKQRIKRTE